jgi:hypothetical protein
MRETFHSPGRDWIAHCCDYNRNGTSQFCQDWNYTIPQRNNGIRIQRDEIRGIGPHQIHVVRGPALVELNIAALGPSQPCQFLPERLNAGLNFRITLRKGYKNSDPPHPIRLLCTRRKRPCRRPADQRNELALFQLIELHTLPLARGAVTA